MPPFIDFKQEIWVKRGSRTCLRFNAHINSYLVKLQDCTLANLKAQLEKNMKSPIVKLQAIWPIDEESVDPLIVTIDSEEFFQEMIDTFFDYPKRRWYLIRLFVHDASSKGLTIPPLAGPPLAEANEHDDHVASLDDAIYDDDIYHDDADFNNEKSLGMDEKMDMDRNSPYSNDIIHIMEEEVFAMDEEILCEQQACLDEQMLVTLNRQDRSVDIQMACMPEESSILDNQWVMEPSTVCMEQNQLVDTQTAAQTNDHDASNESIDLSMDDLNVLFEQVGIDTDEAMAFLRQDDFNSSEMMEFLDQNAISNDDPVSSVEQVIRLIVAEEESSMNEERNSKKEEEDHLKEEEVVPTLEMEELKECDMMVTMEELVSNKNGIPTCDRRSNNNTLNSRVNQMKSQRVWRQTMRRNRIHDLRNINRLSIPGARCCFFSTADTDITFAQEEQKTITNESEYLPDEMENTADGETSMLDSIPLMKTNSIGDSLKWKGKLKRVWRSAKKVLRTKSSKTKDQRFTLPLQSNPQQATSQQDAATNSTTNTTNTTNTTTSSTTAVGKKAKKRFNEIVERASKTADKLMDRVCMPRARRDSQSDCRPGDGEAGEHPPSPTIKAIRADAPRDQSLAQSIHDKDGIDTATKSKGTFKVKLQAVTKTLQWKKPMEKIRRVSLCLPCMSGAATMTKA